ncbi:hypothetical protein [Nitrospirillum amazonense]|uniref:hypothetical protein n=1 Tax=Nitrospirillum amazonense TaxID=28077 RepID=UPI0024122331|nr:hypothetical protein [Nitrospirillum amazonense]MDG3442147.1 hypothetical protein [Nitrospirillum amazonense]
MNKDKKTIEAALLRKGFKKSDGDHHYYIYWNLEGKKTTKRTKISHGTGAKSIGDSLLSAMAKQVGLCKKDFISMVDCHIDQAKYEAIAFSQISSADIPKVQTSPTN